MHVLAQILGYYPDLSHSNYHSPCTIDETIDKLELKLLLNSMMLPCWEYGFHLSKLHKNFSALVHSPRIYQDLNHMHLMLSLIHISEPTRPC